MNYKLPENIEGEPSHSILIKSHADKLRLFKDKKVTLGSSAQVHSLLGHIKFKPWKTPLENHMFNRQLESSEEDDFREEQQNLRRGSLIKTKKGFKTYSTSWHVRRMTGNMFFADISVALEQITEAKGEALEKLVFQNRKLLMKSKERKIFDRSMEKIQREKAEMNFSHDRQKEKRRKRREKRRRKRADERRRKELAMHQKKNRRVGS